MSESSVVLIDRIKESKNPLLILLLAGVVIRLMLAPTLTFNIDVGYWAEVVDVFKNGFGLYGTAGYYYTPIWGYYLGSVSFIAQLLGISDFGTYIPEMAHLVNEDFKITSFVTSVQFNTLVKIPLIAIDIATAFLLYNFVKKQTNDEGKSLLAFSLWIFSPIIITQSSVHGMFDNLSAMLMLMTVIFLFDRRYFIAGMVYSFAILTKFFPLFFIFFLVAFVLKKEGLDMNGIRMLATAIVGSIVGLVVVYIPNIINGDFWLSLYFLAYRIGLTRETLASIGPTATVAIIAALILAIVIFLFVIYRFGPVLAEKLERMDKKERDRKVAKILLYTSLALIAIAGVVILVTTLKNPQGLESFGLKGVLLICIFSIFLEIYLGYRMLMSEDFDDKKVITYLFLTALSVILWPCAPSYYLVVLPFVIIYCAIIDIRYIRPYLLISLALTLQEITAFMTSPTSLILMIVGNVNIMIPVYEFLALPVIMGITGSALLGFVAIIGYLSIINISYKWYSEYYRGGKS